MVALGEFGHAFADLLHHAGALVPEDEGQRQRDRAGDRGEIRVAHAAGAEAHEDFAALRTLDGNFFDYDRLIVLAAEDRFRLACHRAEYSWIK